MQKEDKKFKYSISGYNSFIKNYEKESDRAVIRKAVRTLYPERVK